MMQQPLAPEAVRPDPATTRTIGILNAVFGMLLVAIIPCLAVAVTLSANMGRLLKFEGTQINATVQNVQRRRLDDLAKRAESAKTPEEKAQIEVERTRVLTGVPVAPSSPDIDPMVRYLRRPLVVGFYAAEFGSGFLLNLAMVVSGLGLLFLKNWARRLAVGVAALKVARLVVLYGFYLAVVGPTSAEVTRQAFLEDLQRDPALAASVIKTSPEEAAASLARSMRTSSTIFGLGVPLIGMIYPVIVLRALTGPGVRAACRRPKAAPGLASEL